MSIVVSLLNFIQFTLAVAWPLVCAPPDQAVQVQVLAGDIVFYSWARCPALAVPLSHHVYKRVLAV